MESRLLQLPTELKLAIFEQVSAKDIQRARRVCTELRDLLDAKKDILAATIKNKELARLNEFVNHHNYAGLLFTEALGRWTHHRGIFFGASFRDSIAPFVSHFCEKRSPGRRLTSDDKEGLIWLANKFCSFYLAEFVSPCDSRGIPYFPPPGKLCAEFIASFPWEERAHVRRVSEVLYKAASCLGGVVHTNVTPRECGPKVPLTSFRQGLDHVKTGIVSEADLVDLLDPSLQSKDIFAYCVDDKETAEMVERVVHGNTSPLNHRLDTLREAAILEELYVY